MVRRWVIRLVWAAVAVAAAAGGFVAIAPPNPGPTNLVPARRPAPR